MFPPHHGGKLAGDRADWIAIEIDINRRKGNTCVWTRYQEWDGGNLTEIESRVNGAHTARPFSAEYCKTTDTYDREGR